MNPRVLVMAGKDSDADRIFEYIIRAGRQHGLFSRASSAVLQARTLDEAIAALPTAPELIFSSVAPAKIGVSEPLSAASIAYLAAVKTYRDAQSRYVPLVLSGNYISGIHDSRTGYHPLEHGAVLAQPDVCMVEQRYSDPRFLSIAHELARLFSEPELYRSAPRLVTSVGEKILHQTRVERSMPQHFSFGVHGKRQTAMVSLPDYFTQQQEFVPTQTHP